LRRTPVQLATTNRLVFNSLNPRLLKLKLLKEIRQCQLASQPGRVIVGKASAFDTHTHRFAASHNSPAPRRRIGLLAGHHYVIGSVVHFLIAEFSISDSVAVVEAKVEAMRSAAGGMSRPAEPAKWALVGRDNPSIC
jgi:hypothetical protein